MKRGRWIVVVVLLLVGGRVSLIMVSRQREPEHNGKKLSELLDMWGNRADLGSWEDRKLAVRQIGTNALPFLLRWIQYETPAWRKGVSAFARRLNLHVSFLSAETVEFYRAESAIMGFAILGTEAKGAIPELLELTRAKYNLTQARAGRALGALGPDGVSALLGMLTNRPAGLGTAMIWGWQTLGTNANLGIPVLVEQLKNTNQQVASTAAQVLGFIHLQPGTVVPALSNAAWASDAEVRRYALYGLVGFGVEARPVAPVMIMCLDDSDPNVRVAATNALSKIAPEALESNR